MGKTTLFIYGTLRDDALREAVLGRPTPLRPATLPDHRVMRVAGETFPMVVPSPGDMLEPSPASSSSRTRWSSA